MDLNLFFLLQFDIGLEGELPREHSLATAARKYHFVHRFHSNIDRHEFDKLYSVLARSKLNAACRKLLAAWRAYRLFMKDRGIVMITQQHRIVRYQRQTFYYPSTELWLGRGTNVFEQLCALNILGLCPHFEPRLIMVIAKYLLPGLEQHGMYYGFRGRRSAIDLTYEQDMIEDEICTKAELFAHNNPPIHADDLLPLGWDYNSDEDGDWVA